MPNEDKEVAVDHGEVLGVALVETAEAVAGMGSAKMGPPALTTPIRWK